MIQIVRTHARRVAALAGLLALALPAGASAENLRIPGAGRITVGGFLGGMLFPSDSGLGNAHYPDDVPQSGVLFGLRFGYGILDQLSVEGEVGLTPTSLPH
ncbi:MAG: hypothetical protein RIT45_1311, partial [Pseudomonadota bacterium]